MLGRGTLQALIVGAALVVAAPAYADDDRDGMATAARMYIEEADEAFARGNYGEALDLYTRARALMPDASLAEKQERCRAALRAARGDAPVSPVALGAPPAADKGGTSSPARPWAWVALGVGTAAATVGVITGVLGASRTRSVKEQCVDMTCSPSAVDDLESARTLGSVSTAALVVGGVSLVTGGILLLVTRPASSPKTNASGVRPFVSLGGGGVSGAF